jgi:hypothetical protein
MIPLPFFLFNDIDFSFNSGQLFKIMSLHLDLSDCFYD